MRITEKGISADPYITDESLAFALAGRVCYDGKNAETACKFRDGIVMKVLRYLAKPAVVFAAGIAVLFLAMVLVWCIPDEWVAGRQRESLALFDENGNEQEWPFAREGDGWEWIFTHARGAQLDNGTDRTMILNVTSDASGEGVSVFYKAMDCNDYARYWHGYLLFLRPMMLFLSYMQIRYLYMFLYMLLGAAVMLRINRNFGNRMTYLWVFCCCFIYPVILPFSLQYSSVFFIMMGAVLAADRVYESGDPQRTGIFFMILGMLTSYFDFLTAPLLTLGVPLLYLLLLRLERCGSESFGRNMADMALGTAMWGGAYFGCWAMKWILAGPILRRNVIQDGLSSAVNRTVTAYHTSTGYDTGSLRAIAMNLFAILPPGITGAHWKGILCAALFLALILLAVFVRFHAGRRELKAALPFAVVACYPFVWFAAVSQHTGIHYVFTYRMELITLLGAAIAYVKSIRIRRMTGSGGAARDARDPKRGTDGSVR